MCLCLQSAASLDRAGFAKLLRRMGHIRQQDEMPSEPWLRMCEGVGADPSAGLSQGQFSEILSEELQANGASQGVSRGAAAPPVAGGPVVRQVRQDCDHIDC